MLKMHIGDTVCLPSSPAPAPVRPRSVSAQIRNAGLLHRDRTMLPQQSSESSRIVAPPPHEIYGNLIPAAKDNVNKRQRHVAPKFNTPAPSAGCAIRAPMARRQSVATTQLGAATASVRPYKLADKTMHSPDNLPWRYADVVRKDPIIDIDIEESPNDEVLNKLINGGSASKVEIPNGQTKTIILPRKNAKSLMFPTVPSTAVRKRRCSQVLQNPCTVQVEEIETTDVSSTGVGKRRCSQAQQKPDSVREEENDTTVDDRDELSRMKNKVSPCSVRLEQLPRSTLLMENISNPPPLISNRHVSASPKRKIVSDTSESDSDDPDQFFAPSSQKLPRHSNVVGANCSEETKLALESLPDIPRIRRKDLDRRPKPAERTLRSSYFETKPESTWMNNNRPAYTRRAKQFNDSKSGSNYKSRIERDSNRDDSEDEELQRAILESKRLDDKIKRMDADAAKLPIPSSGIPLTDIMLKDVKTQFGRPADTKIVTKFRLTIKQSHLALFNERQWLEDPLIDFYLEMIKDRNERMRAKGLNVPKIYVFHGYFFKLCWKNEFDAVKEFTNDNIFDYDLAFFPILIRDHWRLIVADFKKKTLYCYDSLFRVNDLYLKTIAKYLEQEYKLKVEKQLRASATKLHQPMHPDIPFNSATMSPESEPEVVESDFSEANTLPLYYSNSDEDVDVETVDDSPKVPERNSTTVRVAPWEIYFKDWSTDTLDPIQTPLPQQKNGHDCGIFLCQYAESLARGVEPPFDFSQVNMLYFRYLMAFETIHGQLVDRGIPNSLE